MLKGEWGGWNNPLARATRGLRRMGKERPGALLARRTRTVKLCSFDARSWDYPSHPLKMNSSLRPCLGEGASLGKAAVLADAGREGGVAARVGRVRRLAFLNILRNNSSTRYLQITRIFKPIAT